MCRYASGLEVILVEVQKQANNNPQLEVVRQSAEDLHGMPDTADSSWHSIGSTIRSSLHLDAVLSIALELHESCTRVAQES